MSEKMSLGSVEEFQKKCEQAAQSADLNTNRFLDMAKKAYELRMDRPESGHAIANSMASVWLKHDSLREEPSANSIGELFAELELPDAHVDTSRESVDEKWEKIAKIADSEKKG